MGIHCFYLPELENNFYHHFIEELFPLHLSMHFKWKFPDFCRSHLPSHSQHLVYNGHIIVSKLFAEVYLLQIEKIRTSL